jgi:hypothetical protein
MTSFMMYANFVAYYEAVGQAMWLKKCDIPPLSKGGQS